MDIYRYWESVLTQNAAEMKGFFHESAYVNFHNTGEHFTVNEFIRVNCEYPGKWDGNIERIEKTGDLIITAVRVFAEDEPLSFHVVSFIRMAGDKIISVDEYWGDDGDAPEWRRDMQIGIKLK